MILDNNLVFSSGQSLITNASTGSTGIIDLSTGVANTGTTYVAPLMSFGNASVFGEDLGIGSGESVPKIGIYIGTAFATSTAATLNVAFQGAVDAAAGTYPANLSGLTWTTYDETGPIAAASLVANGVIRMWWPHRAIGAALPRFVRLLYQLPAATSFTTGSIATAIVMLSRDDWSTGNYPNNFVAV